MAAETSRNTEWREVVTAVATLTKDYTRRSFYIQVYDLVGWQRVEEVEVAKGTQYLCSETLFHQLATQKRIMGLKFASEVDARAFAVAVRAVVGAGPQKPEGPPPPSPKELAAPSQQQQAPETEHQDSHGTKADTQQAKQEPQHSQLPQQQEPYQQHQQQSSRELPMFFPLPPQPGDKATTLDRRRGSKKITKDMIGYPTNFQHIYHVGFNPETGPQHLRLEEREQQVTFKAGADSPRRPAPPPPPTRHTALRMAVEASVSTPDTPETVASAELPVSAGALGSPGVLQFCESSNYNQGDILEYPPVSADTSSPPDIISPLREAQSPSPPHTSSQELSLVSSDPVEGEFSILITTKEATTSSESTKNNIDMNHADQDSATVSLELSLSDSPQTSEIQCVSVDTTGAKYSISSEESNSFSDIQKQNIPADPEEPNNSSYTTPEDSDTSIIPVPSGTSLSNPPAAINLSPLIDASISPQTHSIPVSTSTQSIISSSTRASAESSSNVSSTAERRPPSPATTTTVAPLPSSTATTIQSASSTTTSTPRLAPSSTAIAPRPASSTTTANSGSAPFTTATNLEPVPSPTTITTEPAPISTTTTVSGLASASTTTPRPVSSASPTTEPNHFVASSMNSHSFPTSTSTPTTAIPSAAVPHTSPSASSNTTATDPCVPLDTVCGMSPPTPPPPRQRKRPVTRQSPSSAPPPPPSPCSAPPLPPSPCSAPPPSPSPCSAPPPPPSLCSAPPPSPSPCSAPPPPPSLCSAPPPPPSLCSATPPPPSPCPAPPPPPSPCSASSPPPSLCCAPPPPCSAQPPTPSSCSVSPPPCSPISALPSPPPPPP
ncbi:uncharacterized protein [Panulirus ornatus]